ncbi:DUF4123 domain-containing protein [Stutzerimonas nitrititolerans]|uniref:DUF4123 domain-containing protein n=1 Tax=Stutzerimonas nitrititolerans TaxID=2482751 RepID=UPI00289A137F|nr:DUF4123 domain-containing protein [Stutzerimonas nitrititolerans]
MWQESEHGLMRLVEEPDIERDNLYLLLDGAALPALKIIYQNDDNPRLERLYRGTRHEAMLEVSPVLYSLSGQHLMWQNREQWQSAGLLLESAASIDDLANHLRSLQSVRLPSGELTFCRFYDPALSERFFNSLTQDELRNWLGPISGIWLTAGQKEWRGFATNQVSLCRSASEEGWFSIRPEHLAIWQEQERQLFIQRLVSHFSADDLCGKSAPGLEAIVNQRVVAAETFGICSEQQLFAYVELALQFPEAIDNPEIRTDLANMEESAEHRLARIEASLLGLHG